MRTRVTNPGAIDNKFISLAVGVVFISAGAAIAAPSLMWMASGASVHPIEQVIVGLDCDAMRTAPALEAFPDESGRAFMTSLATHFPQQHERLPDQLTDTAAAGGDRDDLFLSMTAWTMGFASQHISALGRTGAEGFDKSQGILKDVLQMVESETGGYSMKSLEGFMEDLSRLADLTHFGSDGYRMTMRAGATMVDLVARGRNAPPVRATIRPDDENALQSTFMSIMSDPQVMNLIQSDMNLHSQDMQVEFAQNINVCSRLRYRRISVRSRAISAPPSAPRHSRGTARLRLDAVHAAGLYCCAGSTSSPRTQRPAWVTLPSGAHTTPKPWWLPPARSPS